MIAALIIIFIGGAICTVGLAMAAIDAPTVINVLVAVGTAVGALGCLLAVVIEMRRAPAP